MTMTHTSHGAARGAVVLAAALLPGTVHASCGSAFCTLLNDRFALGNWDQPGLSVDLRLDFVTQDRLRSGTKNLAPSDVAGEDTIERHTHNRTLVTTIDYAPDAQWSFALRLPVVQRDHVHDLLDPQTGAVGPTEQWKFTRPGDVQLLGRRQFSSESGTWAWALTGGLKLPTGMKRLVNADGARAERALQPGTGTTDAVLGLSLRRTLGLEDAVTVQSTLTEALNSSEDFKPGRRVELSAGWAHALSPRWSAVLQLNAAHRARDSGDQAEPDNSGSTTLSVSPGVSAAVAEHDTVYAFVQLPLYQKVNGIQLAPRANLALGWTHGF